MDRLPRDAFQLIAEKISHHTDVLRIAAVSKQCHSVVMDNLHLLPPQLPLRLCLPSLQPLPMLMQCHNGDEEGMIDYLSVSINKNYSGSLLPEISRKWIAGSSNGWLFVIEIDGKKIQLLNPLTRAQIPLPSLSTFDYPTDPEYDEDDFGFIEKGMISADPKRNDDCIAMAIISGMSVLSFCKLSDNKWTNIEGCPMGISDVITHKGRFYAITLMGSLVACDATRDGNVEVILVGTSRHEKRYLFESTSGDLLHVARIFEEGETSVTESFVAYKLEAVDGDKEARRPEWFERLYTSEKKLIPTEQVTGFQWVELESLGDQVLFLGHNSSIAVSADSVPGCRRNCIYFTDDYDDLHVCLARGDGKCDSETDEDGVGGEMVLYYDMGLYDMEDGSIESFGELKDKTFAVPPIWVSPNPW